MGPGGKKTEKERNLPLSQIQYFYEFDFPKAYTVYASIFFKFTKV